MSARRGELYVYYRVASAAWPDAVATVKLQQRRLCSEHAGLVARVLRRQADAGDSVTLMEVYARDGEPHGIDAALEAQIAANAGALAPWRIGERHVESFEDLD